jgi:chromosome segregation protein
MLISEMILENFMSYEYARIPLKPGVNIICGPNGAGKSSILLGISVALGQSYTERSKKLSDLIRWGKDIGRVTIVLNNSKVRGRRPVPKINKDQIYLTRVLRRDGKYWFEIDGVAASKADVLRLLSRFNVDPDNMLIIMHQDMAEQFVLLSPQEKLKLVESAVGLEPYRRNVLDAQSKLNKVLSQEESLNKMLESAEQTLNYWREQYERYQEKKQLTLKRRFLERELLWAEVAEKEEEANKIRKNIEEKKSILERIRASIKDQSNLVESINREIASLKDEWRRILEERILIERERAHYDSDIKRGEEILGKMRNLLEEGVRSLKDLSRINSPMNLENMELESADAGRLEIAKTIKGLNEWFNLFRSRINELEGSTEVSKIKLADLEIRLLDVKDEMYRLENKIDGLMNSLIDGKVNLALLNYQENELLKEIDSLNESLNNLLSEINDAIKRAEERGSRIAVLRSPSEIIDEIRIIDGRLSAMADISEDVEKMYESYSKLYFELKEKARMAAENREKTLEEIRARMESWRNIVSNILENVNNEYRNILLQVAGDGFVRLINENDIEAAGLEIYVGFKGSQPIPLNIYSQSGGERSTATMAFLLALQKHIKSPFRAIDEYDVHMDPRNREIIANLLISAVAGEGSQYLAITPNQMFFENKDVHIIIVQNIEGKSVVKEVA